MMSVLSETMRKFGIYRRVSKSSYYTSANMGKVVNKKLEIEIDYLANTYKVYVNGMLVGAAHNIPDYDFSVKMQSMQISIQIFLMKSIRIPLTEAI